MNGNQLQQRYASGDRNFQGLDLSGVDLSGQDLREANFSGSDCYGTQFTDSLLNRANFSGKTNLAYADLRGADLSEANLSGANLDGAKLERAIAQGAIYDDQTTFPIGFDPIAVGAIHTQILEQQTRIAQVTALKNQPLPSPPPSSPEPPPSSTPPSPPPAPESPVSNPPVSNPSTPPPTVTATPTPQPFSDPQPIPQPPSPTSCSTSCLGILVGMALVVGLGYAFTNASKLWTGLQSSDNPFANRAYPLPACGDPLPNTRTNMYPVFVNNPAQNLAKIRSEFCRDAYETRRQGQSIRVVQVASFSSQIRAQQFAEFMVQKVGSGEVGTPTPIN